MGMAEREIEALLVASPEAIELVILKQRFGAMEVDRALNGLKQYWSGRGMVLRIKGERASLVPDAICAKVLADGQGGRVRRLSAAAVETLSYIALNQPVSVSDIESARGVQLFKGILDSLLDAGLVQIHVRRSDSGRAISYSTTEYFMDSFGLSALTDLPTPDELEGLIGQPHDDVSELDRE